MSKISVIFVVLINNNLKQNLMSIFKKKQTNVIDLMRDKEVVYRVTIDPKFVQFESASKDWLVRYGAGTFAAGIVNFLVQQNELEGLTEFVRVQYLAQWMFQDAAMIKEFYRILERSQKRIANAQKRDENDEVVLAEQKVMHEQTVESVEEYEKKRNSKKK